MGKPTRGTPFGIRSEVPQETSRFVGSSAKKKHVFPAPRRPKTPYGSTSCRFTVTTFKAIYVTRFHRQIKSELLAKAQADTQLYL